MLGDGLELGVHDEVVGFEKPRRNCGMCVHRGAGVGFSQREGASCTEPAVHAGTSPFPPADEPTVCITVPTWWLKYLLTPFIAGNMCKT